MDLIKEVKLLPRSIEFILPEKRESLRGLHIVTFKWVNGFDMTLRPQTFFANDYKVIPFTSEMPFTMQTDLRVKIEKMDAFYRINFR